MSSKRNNSNSSKSSPQLSKQIRKQSRDSDSSCSEKRYGKFWKPHEDNQLIDLHRQYNGNWKLISQEIPGRNPSQCQQRWKRINPNKSKMRKQWSDEEDREVIRLVELHGRNWKMIEGCMQGRTSKQIRERFLNNLDPEINKEKFTEQEDNIILQQYKIYGPKWSEIAKCLDRRPENQVKNRFYSYIKRVTKFSDNDDDDDENENESIEQQQEHSIEKPVQIQLETIHSVQEENNNNNTRNDSLLNQTPSNRNQPLIQLIQDSFDSQNYQPEQFEISPFNQQRRILDYSPINFQQAHHQLTFNNVVEDYRELRSQIESLNLEKHL